jgi:Fe-S cluster assembly protein SufB
MTRGLQKDQARALIIHGFIDVFVEALPMEYAVEINRFIAYEMEGH